MIIIRAKDLFAPERKGWAGKSGGIFSGMGDARPRPVNNIVVHLRTRGLAGESRAFAGGLQFY